MTRRSGFTHEDALHVARGTLEFRADPGSPCHDGSLRRDHAVILGCASGGRSALGGKVLEDLGYAEVHNLGAQEDRVENGGEVDKPIGPAMRALAPDCAC